MLRVRELFAGVDVTVDGADVEVRSLTCDSRRVAAGACFASLPGARADGHAYIPQALERGAASILCERPVEVAPATRIVAKDARLALATAARRFFGDPATGLCMVGVTGTNGKTTTTYLVEGILRAAGRTPAVIGTLGYRYLGREATTGLTTPESVDLVALLAEMREAGVDAVAMEVSSHALVQHRVSGVDFDVGVFSNLTHDHLDYHGTMEAYFEAKRLLFSSRLKRSGKAVLNVDDSYGRKLAHPAAVTVSASGAEDAGVRVLASKLGPHGTDLTLHTPRGRLEIHSPLVGGFNRENIVAAVGVGEALGLAPQEIAAGIAAVSAVPGRLERVSREGEPLVVVDYAHTPDALVKVLSAVRGITAGRIICVFGCGGDRDPKKRPSMGEVVAKMADCAVVTNDNPRSEDPAMIATAVEQGLLRGGSKRAVSPAWGSYFVELDRSAAIRAAIAAAQPGDAVVLAGKGHENYQIIGADKRHFDDREEARAALDALRDSPARQCGARAK